MTDGLKEFKATLVAILGNDALSDEKNILTTYGQDDSFTPFQAPALVVWPETTVDVQKIMQAALKCAVPLVPVSSGPSHRQHGDTVPTRTGTVVVDLSNMDKILRIDRTNRVVMVEPGVTWAQLMPEVDKQGLRLLHPLCPRKDKSVLASALEREPTSIPRYHWDASDPLLCTEIVFGTGDLFRTGSAAGPGSIEEQLATGQAQKNPMGPTQFSLFQTIQGAQGSLGIVTWATLKCELKPTRQKMLYAQAGDLHALEGLAASILKFRIGDEVFIMNKAAFASFLNKSTSEASWKEWVMPVTLAGRGRFASDKVAYLEADLLNLGQKYALDLQPELTGVDNSDVLSRFQGTSEKPWPYGFKGSCQSVFCITTIDRAGDFAEKVKQSLASDTLVDYGFYIQPLVQGCNCHFEVQLYYDPRHPEAGHAVDAAFKKVTRLLFDLGGFFSRPYGNWAKEAYDRVSPGIVTVLNKVKGILDPHRVLKPGALCFKEES
nr:FAD-binding oxidoreductase [Candidatus Sigynarchaeum springense]